MLNVVVVVVVVVFNSRGGVLRGNSRGIKTPVAHSYPGQFTLLSYTSLRARYFRVEYSPQAIIALKPIALLSLRKVG